VLLLLVPLRIELDSVHVTILTLAVVVSPRLELTSILLLLLMLLLMLLVVVMWGMLLVELLLMLVMLRLHLLGRCRLELASIHFTFLMLLLGLLGLLGLLLLGLLGLLKIGMQHT
jgi:hypothetical protein